MGRKVRVAVTRDLFDEEGKSVSPGSGPSVLDQLLDVEWDKFQEYLTEVTPEQAKGFDMVISFAPYWTRPTLSGCEQLLSIHRGGVGYDMVDVPACTDTGVALFIIPSAVRRPVATGIMALMLALATHLRIKDICIRAGKWEEGRKKYPGIGLAGKTLGSIGIGNIGHELFRLVKPFNMKHIACDPYITQESVKDINVQLVDMDTVLAQSDFLNISCPLNEKTRHLLGEKELKKMKKAAYLINTSRGPVIDEVALVRALRENWIQGAGIDVYEQEPTPTDNPLFQMENVILIPHSIGLSDEFFTTMWEEITKQVRQMINGEKPETLVNPEVWDKSEFQNKLKNFHQELK